MSPTQGSASRRCGTALKPWAMSSVATTSSGKAAAQRAAPRPAAGQRRLTREEALAAIRADYNENYFVSGGLLLEWLELACRCVAAAATCGIRSCAPPLATPLSLARATPDLQAGARWRGLHRTAGTPIRLRASRVPRACKSNVGNLGSLMRDVQVRAAGPPWAGGWGGGSTVTVRLGSSWRQPRLCQAGSALPQTTPLHSRCSLCSWR